MSTTPADRDGVASHPRQPDEGAPAAAPTTAPEAVADPTRTESDTGETGPGGSAEADRDRLWSVAEHLNDILARVRPLAPIELRLLDAQGCVLVDDVLAPVALPAFDNSSMDGYAVRAGDVADASRREPVELAVLADIAAGSAESPEVGPGQAARVMTGAAVPPGADAVVPVEWTDDGTGDGPVTAMTARGERGATSGVRVFRPAEPGAHVRVRGDDIGVGTLALAAGTVLHPPQIALLAAIGQDTVRVRPRPRVVVMSTGSELVPPGETLRPGQIHDSNSFQLTAAARDAGAIAYRVGAVPDDPANFRSTVEDQLIRADIVVTSGGVSVGAYDVVKEALREPAVDGGVEFRRLAMQPGKPQGFGFVGDGSSDGVRTPLLALPGNPVSAYVSFELFVRPAIRTLMGLPPDGRPTARAVCETGVATSPGGRRQFLRARYDARAGTVTPVGGAGSHLVKGLAEANALMVVEERATAVSPGAEVDVVPLN